MGLHIERVVGGGDGSAKIKNAAPRLQGNLRQVDPNVPLPQRCAARAGLNNVQGQSTARDDTSHHEATCLLEPCRAICDKTLYYSKIHRSSCLGFWIILQAVGNQKLLRGTPYDETMSSSARHNFRIVSLCLIRTVSLQHGFGSLRQ